MEGSSFDKAIGVAYLIGSYKLFCWTTSVLKYFSRQFIRPLFQSKNHLYNKYGLKKEDQKSKSWAIVTGGSDGIGLSMCKNLAL